MGELLHSSSSLGPGENRSHDMGMHVKGSLLCFLRWPALLSGLLERVFFFPLQAEKSFVCLFICLSVCFRMYFSSEENRDYL